VHARQKFCSVCGGPLRTSETRVRTPKHLAERILRAQPSAEGERKIATVLFADIVNSTPLIEGRDPEEACQILESAVEIMIDAVHRYLGTVTRRLGDGIMASFGAPIALEDHAVMACYAALDMQEAIRGHAARVQDALGQYLQVRVGINSGLVVVTVTCQEGDFREIRVDGVPTHIAARLETHAPAGAILLSRDTLALAEGFVRAGGIAPLSVKGLVKPVEVCELLGFGTRKRIHAHAVRGLSKFVGRRDELDVLSRAAGRAREEGRGQVVALVGEAGVGKSRVFLEFTRSPLMQGWLVLEAGSASYGKATSYFPLVDLLTRYFEIEGRDDERRVRDKIAGKLTSLGDNKLLAQVPLFLGILGIGLGDDVWANLPPPERQSQMFDALKRLLIRESQEQPLCLLFEDLHWIDAETQTFLEMLVESIVAARVLLLVNHRPEYKNQWAGKSSFSQTRIEPLAPESAGELLEGLIGSGAGLGEIKHTLVHKTEGNPLFLEESVRSLIERGVLAGSTGQWRQAGPLPDDFVPPTIDALLAARIDRLPDDPKKILQCAAVIGNNVPQGLLEAVAGMARDKLTQAVRELQAAEFLYEKTLFPETEYAFKHSMTREVSLDSLLLERRKALHASAFHALETLAAGRLDEHVERLADHAERGGLWEQALDYLQRSGAKAYSLYANVEAASFFDRALKVLRQLPGSRENLEQAVDLRFELRNALTPLGEIERIQATLQEIEEPLAGLGDKLRSARHEAFKCNHHFLAGKQRLAIKFGKTGLNLARECGDRAVEGELLYRVGQSYYALGEYRSAIAQLEESLEFTAERFEHNRFDLTVIPAVVSRTWLVNALTECGEFEAGMSHARRALEIAEKAEHPLSQVLAWLASGDLRRRKGELDRAVRDMERGMALCDERTMRVWRLRLASSLGLAYARSGRAKYGLELSRQAVEAAERMQLIVDHAMLLVRLGQASLFDSQFQAAVSYGERALELALAHEARGDEAWARYLIGRAHWSDKQNIDESEKQLEIARQIATACDARPLAAFCQTTLGGIYQLRGDRSTAEKFAAAAEASYKELGMEPLPLDPVR
jgi:predicted ATPase/class 3 adenylate cyclase